ncbi:hypothetical protein FNV43_RR13401 [Rhamnella rubrinervis]|uniref:Uncharacterized protein n=1 Tax=Rhamnella rubrinervis TaxID=2594499 RepID=A0A8K0H0Z9_9ROSA|nr:hypothetical protein FNV43_RR13401 [Rhamnella rubrinervis]
MASMGDYSFYSSPPHSAKPVADSKATSEEESGWTAYFQDLSEHHHQEQHEEQSLVSSCFAATSSMVSDAASHAAWRNSRGGRQNHVGATGEFGSPKTPIRLSFKKTRTKQISAHDDSLEDTASSPVNSPKIGDLRQIDHMNPRRNTFDQHNDISTGKGGISENSEVHCDHEEERSNNMGLKNNGKKETCIDLKRRGLCLVPMSMLVNYLG